MISKYHGNEGNSHLDSATGRLQMYVPSMDQIPPHSRTEVRKEYHGILRIHHEPKAPRGRSPETRLGNSK